ADDLSTSPERKVRAANFHRGAATSLRQRAAPRTVWVIPVQPHFQTRIGKCSAGSERPGIKPKNQRHAHPTLRLPLTQSGAHLALTMASKMFPVSRRVCWWCSVRTASTRLTILPGAPRMILPAGPRLKNQRRETRWYSRQFRCVAKGLRGDDNVCPRQGWVD